MDSETIDVDANLLRWQEESRIADELVNFLHTAWPTLQTYILDPINAAAFQKFKSVNADDTSAVIATQMVSRSIDLIRDEIQKRITAGLAARDNIRAYSTLNEDEDHA